MQIIFAPEGRANQSQFSLMTMGKSNGKSSSNHRWSHSAVVLQCHFNLLRRMNLFATTKKLAKENQASSTETYVFYSTAAYIPKHNRGVQPPMLQRGCLPKETFNISCNQRSKGKEIKKRILAFIYLFSCEGRYHVGCLCLRWICS